MLDVLAMLRKLGTNELKARFTSVFSPSHDDIDHLHTVIHLNHTRPRQRDPEEDPAEGGTPMSASSPTVLTGSQRYYVVYRLALLVLTVELMDTQQSNVRHYPEK